jgi:hypothetical protein
MPARPAGMTGVLPFIIQLQLRSAEICPVSDPVHICRARTQVTNAQLGLMPGVELWRSQMAAVANVLLREIHATTAQQPMMDIDVVLSANKADRSVKIVKEHLILGTDKRDAEEQRDLWLSENPSIKVVKIHRVKREPQTLLTLIGSKHVPRVSITVEYQEPDAADANVPAE